MIEVTTATKEAFASDTSVKTLRVVFPTIGKTFTSSDIDCESLRINEALCNRDSIEFVGCIASTLKVNIYDSMYSLKNLRCEVYIKADNTEEIPIFKGIVDSVKMQANKRVKSITAYDVLYSKGELDIADWYNDLSFPTTLANIRQSLFEYIGITEKSTTLPNDGLVIDREYEPATLKCITVIKSICQINGCFGIINRDGEFEYRYIEEYQSEGTYPSLALFPPFYPAYDSGSGSIANTFTFCKDITYEEYVVKPVQRLQIRDNEKSTGIVVGEDSGNKYIIQNNMFMKNIDNSTRTTVATNIYNKIKHVSFRPCNTQNYGMPFVEVGDIVNYILIGPGTQGEYNQGLFYVMSREISGTQLLNDSYKAYGDEEQKEFVTNLQAQIDAIKNGGADADLSNYYTKAETQSYLNDNYYNRNQTVQVVDTEIAEMETPTGISVASVYSLPAARSNSTLYLVGATVVVL